MATSDCPADGRARLVGDLFILRRLVPLIPQRNLDLMQLTHRG